MDVTVETATQDAIILFQTAALSTLAWVIPVAGLVIVSIAVVSFAISMFQKLVFRAQWEQYQIEKDQRAFRENYEDELEDHEDMMDMNDVRGYPSRGRFDD